MQRLILITIFIMSFSAPTFAAHPNGTAYVSVNGLVCDFCARALEKVFSKQASVESIKVSLDEKLITIHFKDGEKLTDETIKSLVADSGYNVQEIRYEK